MDRSGDAEAVSLNRMLCSSPAQLLDYAEQRVPMLINDSISLSLLLVGQGGGRSLLGVGDDLTEAAAQMWFCDHMAWLLQSTGIAGYALCAPIAMIEATPQADARMPVVAIEPARGMLMIRAGIHGSAKAALYDCTEAGGRTIRRVYETSGLCNLPAPIPIFDDLFSRSAFGLCSEMDDHVAGARKRETVH